MLSVSLLGIEHKQKETDMKENDRAVMGDFFEYHNKKYVAVSNGNSSCEKCIAYQDKCLSFPRGCSDHYNPYVWIEYKPLKGN